jgi:hypothetical protein
VLWRVRANALAGSAQDVMKRVFGEKVEITDWSLNPVCGTRLGFAPSTRALGRGDQIGFVTTENFMWYAAGSDKFSLPACSHMHMN